MASTITGKIVISTVKTAMRVLNFEIIDIYLKECDQNIFRSLIRFKTLNTKTAISSIKMFDC